MLMKLFDYLALTFKLLALLELLRALLGFQKRPVALQYLLPKIWQ